MIVRSGYLIRRILDDWRFEQRWQSHAEPPRKTAKARQGERPTWQNCLLEAETEAEYGAVV